MYNKAKKLLTSQGKFHINLGLERITQALELFGNPQADLKFIHVAGTNGKGSTCTMLASIFRSAGYKTGLYTSPHLIEYTERIKINDDEIDKEEFGKLVIEIITKTQSKNIHLTEFEILTVLAFLYFKKEKTNIIMLETGLGGRLDATNIITPILSIITCINLDHIDRLGDTIDKIAFEKAGIIKPEIPVITAKNNSGFEIIKKIAKEKQAPLYLSKNNLEAKENNIFCDEKNAYKLALLGLWQKENLALVLKAVEILQKSFHLNTQQIIEGLSKARIKSRFEYIKDKNLVIDGAHNVLAANLLRKSIDFYFPDKQKVWLYGSLNTKNHQEITKELFQKNDIVILTKSNSIASVEPETLKEQCSLFLDSNNLCCFDKPKEALNRLLSLNNKNSILIATGSLYLTGEVLTLLNTNWCKNTTQLTNIIS